jgi:hypothetical protein
VLLKEYVGCPQSFVEYLTVSELRTVSRHMHPICTVLLRGSQVGRAVWWALFVLVFVGLYSILHCIFVRSRCLSCCVPFARYVSGLLWSGRVGVVSDMLTEPVCR